MKSLITYIKECDFATPMNTLGMGNPTPETDPCVPVAKSKRLKSLKE